MKLGVISSLPVTLEAFFQDWLEEFEALGWKVYTAAGGALPSRSAGHTAISGMRQQPSAGCASAVFQVRRWIRSNQLDAVLTSTATASAVVRAAAIGCRTSVVYFCHGLHFDRRRRGLIGMIESALCSATTGAVVMNDHDEAFFTGRLPLVRLAHGVGLPVERYRQVSEARLRIMRDRKCEDALRVLWIGSLSTRKRPHLAVEMLPELQRRALSGFELRLAGDGPLRDVLRSHAEELGVGRHVTLLGHCDVEKELRHADVVVHTASWEGYCRSLLEASVAGVPSVSFDVKGCREIPWVRTVPDGNVPALAAAVMEIGRGGEVSDEGGFGECDWRNAVNEVHRFLTNDAVVRSPPVSAPQMSMSCRDRAERHA